MLTEEIFENVSKRLAAKAGKKLYIARIAIHVPHLDSETYEEMYEMLANKGFWKVLTRDGQDYELPDAVYAKNAPTGMASRFTKDVFQAVKTITGDMHPEVMIVEVEEMDFLGLAKVTEGL